MQKVSLSNKVFTDNPLLDEIVYNARQLATGTILKDWDKANNNETLESIQNGDVLIAIKRGTATFGNFIYDLTILRKYYGDIPQIYSYAADNTSIPEIDRPILLSMAIELFTENYVEYNNYYRMLHGDPPLDSVEDYEGLWIDVNYIDMSTPTDLSHISPFYIEEKDSKRNVISDYQLIHELSKTNINILESNGTIQNILDDVDTVTLSWGLGTDDVRYINHLGDKSIGYYEARTADRFAMLYCPSCDSEEVRKRYKDLLEANRLYMLYTIYSEAYKYRSDYYDNFMMIFLIIQTIIDMIIELPDYITRRDVFDTRTCKYIFESNGVKYFKNIPLRYQISLVKNLNKLIKYKSTDKCIVDIVSLFGFKDNIKAFRYYILKDRYVKSLTDYDDKGNQILNYYDNTKEVTDSEGNTSIVEDNDKNYDLKFIKVPLLGMYDDYIRNDNYIYDYDTLTLPDNYWIGDKQYETVKSAVKDLDFTVLRSKYYTTEAVIDLTQRNFVLTYFMNILMYNKVDKSALTLTLPNVSTTSKVTLVNAILALYSLGYIYYGVEDTIIDSRAKAAQILGFNMEADLATIAQYLKDYHGGLTMEELFYDHSVPESERYGFQVPDSDTILSYDQLQEIYLKNKDIYDHVREVMLDPPSKEVYNAYRYLYKALFIMNRNMEYFLVGDNEVVDQYKALGYTTKFINIPRIEQYIKEEDYKRDYGLFLAKLDQNTLYFEMAEDFDETHNFDLYIFNGEDIESIKADAHMAFTYREFLRYNDTNLYNFLQNIAETKNDENRQELCINAIQNIVGYMKDYIDQDGDDAIYLDQVFSGLPSISLEFVVKYVNTVIDFFKSFKIFTHQSSVTYVFDDKFEQYIQLIDHILLHYLFDKSEYVKIEDFIYGMTSKITASEKAKIIDKVWLDISTWVQKNYKEYYNSDRYETLTNVIREYLDYTITHNISDRMMIKGHPDKDNLKWSDPSKSQCPHCGIEIDPTKVTPLEKGGSTFLCPNCGKEISFNDLELKYKEMYATDAILNMLVDVTLPDNIISKEDGISILKETRLFDDYYDEWISDIAAIMITARLDDGEKCCTKYYCPSCNKEIESSTTVCPKCGKVIIEPITKIHYITHIKDTASNDSLLNKDQLIHLDEQIFNHGTSNYIDRYSDSITDDIHTIITQQFPAHEFDS